MLKNYPELSLLKENIRLFYDYKTYLDKKKCLSIPHVFCSEEELSRLTSEFMKDNLNYLNETDTNLVNSIIEQETLDLLYEAIDRLPKDLRIIFDLCYEQGKKNAEAAQVLGISESMVKKRKVKMLQMLRATFSDNSQVLYILTILILREMI